MANIIAVVWDFDKTLVNGYMEEPILSIMEWILPTFGEKLIFFQKNIEQSLSLIHICGADNEKLSLNAGNTIASNLKENDKLGWTFVARQEAIKGVKSGEYYAAIIIPEDFSSSLLSVLSGKIEAPQLDYYINEKKNAIAPKFTDTGATRCV